MLRYFFIPFLFFSLIINSQSNYKLGLTLSSDFPVRHYLGLKLCTEKVLSFSLKAGYQYSAYGIGAFLSDNLDVTPSVGLFGQLGSFSTELNFKKPFLKISLDYEIGKLYGDFRTPIEFNNGRDYKVTYYKILAYNHLIMLSLNLYSKKHSNFSFNLKIGGGYRINTETIYYKGYRTSSSKNELNEPVISKYDNRLFVIRFGTTYCFKKLSNSKNKPLITK